MRTIALSHLCTFFAPKFGELIKMSIFNYNTIGSKMLFTNANRQGLGAKNDRGSKIRKFARKFSLVRFSSFLAVFKTNSIWLWALIDLSAENISAVILAVYIDSICPSIFIKICYICMYRYFRLNLIFQLIPIKKKLLKFLSTYAWHQWRVNL